MSSIEEQWISWPFRDVLQEVDYNGWAVVEQDMYPAPFDKPFPIGKHNRDYLREIGIG